MGWLPGPGGEYPNLTGILGMIAFRLRKGTLSKVKVSRKCCNTILFSNLQKLRLKFEIVLMCFIFQQSCPILTQVKYFGQTLPPTMSDFVRETGVVPGCGAFVEEV